MSEVTDAELHKALRVFGLSPGATLEEIKKRKAFQTKVMHEDVVAPSLKEQAKEEMIKMNAAWDVINRWFQEHPDATATPMEPEPAQPEPESQRQSQDEAEGWDDFQGRTARRWQDGVSLEELNKKRQKDLAVKSRRDFVFKAKVAGGVIATFMILSNAVGAPSSNALKEMGRQGGWMAERAEKIHANQSFAFFTLLAYLGLCFVPAARQKTEAWIGKAE